MSLSASPTPTRLSNTFVTPIATSTTSGLLVKIYPLTSIGQPLPIESSGITIGRDEACTLSIDDDSVSRRHATIEWDGEGYKVRDLGSTNGTFVNSNPVQEAVLQGGDRVRFGKHIYKYLSSSELESEYHETVFKMMTTDGLTQVYNKRYFVENLEREIENNSRTDDSLCVLLMDLDKFKSVNDTYGHLAGDAVLVEFASRVKKVLRSGELFARYGGEEFVLMCTKSRIANAALTAERIRAVVASEPILFEKTHIPVTVSIGIAQCDASFLDDYKVLLATADKFLYRAKEQGRNQVQYEGRDA